MENIIGRVSIRKSDSKLIEFQSGIDTEGNKTLEQNAINSGYKTEDIEEREVTAEDYNTIMKLQPVPVPEKIKKIMKLKHPKTEEIIEWEVIE